MKQDMYVRDRLGLEEEEATDTQQNENIPDSDVVTYGIIEEIHSLGGETRTSYGIAAYADAATDGAATIVASIRDISVDRQQLAHLVETCNRLGLSPIHLAEIVEDLLAD